MSLSEMQRNREGMTPGEETAVSVKWSSFERLTTTLETGVEPRGKEWVGNGLQRPPSDTESTTHRTE